MAWGPYADASDAAWATRELPGWRTHEAATPRQHLRQAMPQSAPSQPSDPW